MPTEISAKLEYARKRSGLTLQQLSERCVIGVSSLSEFETGTREPRLAQLQQIAKELNRSVSFFLGEGPLPTEAVCWRERPKSPDAEEIETRFLRHCEQYHNLEMWCNDVRQLRLPSCRIPSNSFNHQDAQSLAEEFRKEFGLGDRAAPELPLVLEEVCGIKIFHLCFEPSGTAACVKSANFGAAILLNASNARWRRNFDLAHELFHLLTWDTFASADGALCEQYANSFASALLMPAAAVQSAISRIKESHPVRFSDVFDLARQFDVSIDALFWRIHKLYSHNEEDTRRRIEQCKAMFSMEKENVAPPVRPARFDSLAVRALREGEISIGRFAEYMGISRSKAQTFIIEEPVKDEEVQFAPA